MKTGIFILSWYLLQLLEVCFSATIDQDKGALDTAKPEYELPPTLSTEEFDLAAQSSLAIIEFYSPYCSHCKTLAPIWKQTVETFTTSEELKEYNDKIAFYQVNCVERGDLCSREKIKAYPSIKLYGPDGFIKDYPSDFKRTEKDFIKFAKLETLEFEQQNVDNDISSESKNTKIDHSKYLNGVDILNIISGGSASDSKSDLNFERPWLVSFWPSSELVSDSVFTDSKKEMDQIFKKCPTCFYAYKNWKVLTQSLHAHEIETGVFNCFDDPNSKSPTFNKKICTELGILDSLDEPKFMVILPQKKYNNVFKYKMVAQNEVNTFNIKDIIDFSLRIVHNAQIPDINTMELRRFVTPDIKALSKNNVNTEKIYVVFNYEQGTLVQEEKDLLEHLIQPITDIPNLYLYKNSQDLSAFSEKITKTLFEQINYNASESEKNIDYNVYHNKMISQKPTFYIFKENSLVPNVLSVFATVELRDVTTVMNWIKRNSLPSVVELKEENAASTFQFEKKYYSQVAILFVDSNLESSKDLINNYRLASFDYEMLRWNKNYEVLENSRTEKNIKIKQLKQELSSGDRSLLFDEMKKELYLDRDKRCVFAYVDIAKTKDLAELGIAYPFEINDRAGEIIVIDNSKPSIKLYAYDTFGQILTASSPYYLKEVLKSLNLESINSIPFTIKLKDSKYLKGFDDPDKKTRAVTWLMLVTIVILFSLVLKTQRPKFIYSAFVALKRKLNFKAKNSNTVNLGILGVKDPKLMS